MAVIVLYKKQHYLWYTNTAAGAAKLISSTRAKYSGTPHLSALHVVHKKLEHHTYNNHRYVKTKLGIFSCSTGKRVATPQKNAILTKENHHELTN